MIIPYMKIKIHIVTRLSKIDVLNGQTKPSKNRILKEKIPRMFRVLRIFKFFMLLFLNLIN